MRYRACVALRRTLPSCHLLRHLPALVLLACAFALAACSNAQPDPVSRVQPPVLTPTSQPATPVPMRAVETPLQGDIAIWHSLSDTEHPVLASMLDQLSRTHPDLDLTSVYMEPHRVPEQLLNAILSGTGPNLLVAPASHFPDLRAEHLVTSWNDVLRDEDLAAFVPPALFGLIHESALMGIPLWAETVMLFVNTDLVSRSEMPDDLEQLLTQATHAPAPILGLYPSLFHLSWGFPAFGGVLFDTQYRVVLDQSDGGALFLAWLRRANRTPGIRVSMDYAALKQAFLDGEMPLFIDGPWLLPEAEAALGSALQIRGIPEGPAGPSRPWLTTEAVFLVAGQSEVQQALSARTALLMAGMEEHIVDTVHRLPAVQDASNLGPAPVRQFRKLLPAALQMPHVPELQSVWPLGQEMLQKAVNTEEKTEDLVARFALLANEENGK